MNLTNLLTDKNIKQEIRQLSKEANEGQAIVEQLFSKHNSELTIQTETKILDAQMMPKENPKSMPNRILEAQKDIDEWSKTGKPPRYNALTLAKERIKREIANEYIKNNSTEISLINHIHEAIISYAIVNGLSEKMIAEGKNGKKLGVIEISSRITPVLTFPDSSKYFNISILPYDIDSRKIIGEKTESNIVSEDSVIESAANLQRTFKVFYALAETSSAPRTDVPKSGRKPEVYICSIKGDEKKVTYHTIDVMLRPQFDARVRELMYMELLELYK